jgi:beta-glucosidase
VPFHLVSDVEGITTALGSNVNVLYERGLPTVRDLARDTPFTTAADAATKGVTMQTFDNRDLSGSPTETKTEPHIMLTGLSWATLADDFEAAFAAFFGPHKSSSHRFTGFYTAPAAGNYILALEGAGEGNGDRVYLDDKLIIDDWTQVRAFSPHLTLPLSAGPHKVVVEQWQNGPVGGHIRFSIIDPTKVVNPKAIALAKMADTVIVAAGFGPESEGEGGDRTFDLPAGQDELIEAMASANPHTIVSITSGGNVDSTKWVDHVPVLLESWYAGQEGGKALAEILFGQVNPSGHLPVTFERKAEDNPAFANYYPEGDSIHVEYKEGIFVGYRGYEHSGTKPLFPFGYGLSYTTFAFSNLKVVPEFNSTEPHVTVFFDVKNTGSRAGADVAQVYVGEDHPLVPRPIHELKGFERVQLNPGETKHVSVTLDKRAFAYYDVTGKDWKIDPGHFTISVGDSVASLPLTGGVESPK